MVRRLITTIAGALLVVALTTAASAAEEPTPPPPTESGGEGTVTPPPVGDPPPTDGSPAPTDPLPDPPSDCQGPDEAAIAAAQDRFVEATVAALDEANRKYAELTKQGNPTRAALDAALEDARTAESIEAAFAAAVVSTNAYHDAFQAAASAHKAAVRKAGEIARYELLKACEDPANIEDAITPSIDEWIALIDSQIKKREDTRRAELAALEAEKAAALDALAGDGDGNGGDNGDGDGNGPPPTRAQGGGDTPPDSGGQQPSADDGSDLGALPFAGTAALPLLIAGLILVAGGAAAVVLSRRRRDGQSDG